MCMRVPSSRSKTLKDGSTGWLHSLDGPRPPVRQIQPEKPKFTVNCRALMAGWMAETTPEMYRKLSETLGVHQWTLAEHGLSCAYAEPYQAWAFSMWDGHGHCIGIRLRSLSGYKWTVKDTHAGIFVPMINPQSTVLICEGPTDTAAGLSLGYYAVGRPSCSGGAPMLKDLIRKNNVKRAIIVADADDPGLNGARSLVSVLQVPACILTLPTKDLREFHRSGGTRQALECLAKNSVWHNRK